MVSCIWFELLLLTEHFLEKQLFLNGGDRLWRLLFLIAYDPSEWLLFLDNIERLCLIFETPIVIESITASE